MTREHLVKDFRSRKSVIDVAIFGLTLERIIFVYTRMSEKKKKRKKRRIRIKPHIEIYQKCE
jgi:hypothetical protein